MPTSSRTSSDERSVFAPRGCFGLIATRPLDKAILASPDSGGFARTEAQFILRRKRFKWPGQAAVTVSVV